jgi:hypothetical protein
MAISVIQAPKLITPAHNDSYIIVSSDNVDTQYGFYYLFEFFVTRIGELIPSTPALSLKVLPNPLNMGTDYVAGYGELNINKVLQDLTQFELIEYDDSSITPSLLNTNCLRYNIKVSEVYSETANGTPSIQLSENPGDYYLIDGVLYNSQYWDFEEDLLSLFIPSGFTAGDTPYPIFLTNRPEISEAGEIDSLHIINNGTNTITNNFEVIHLVRQPTTQPIVADTEWLLEGNDQTVSLDATATGEFWTSKILAVNGGYWRYFYDEDGNITNPYNLQSTGNPSYSGSYRRFRQGMVLSDVTLRYTLQLSTWASASMTGYVQILGRTPNTSTWTVLATSNSTTFFENPFDVLVGFPNITLSQNYDELGIRFINVPYDAYGVCNLSSYLYFFPYTTTSSISAILIKGYNDANQLVNIDEILLNNTYKAQGFKFNSFYFTGLEMSYFRAFAWVHTDNPIDEERMLRLSEIKTIQYRCKSLFGSKTKTIIWQNRLGGWDSYEFVVTQSIESSIKKENYVAPKTRLTTRESQQRKSTGRLFTQNVTLTTDNINKVTINWLKELLDAENIYQVDFIGGQYRLTPISVTIDSVTEKPFNNLYSQLKFSYTYSQIETTR